VNQPNKAKPMKANKSLLMRGVKGLMKGMDAVTNSNKMATNGIIAEIDELGFKGVNFDSIDKLYNTFKFIKHKSTIQIHGLWCTPLSPAPQAELGRCDLTGLGASPSSPRPKTTSETDHCPPTALRNMRA
jgi:hypothetical protein